MDPRKALESLLLAMFSSDELRRLLRYLPDGDALVRALPGSNASPAAVVTGAVETLEKTNYLAEEAFWSALLHERPRRAAEIERVRTLVRDAAAAAAAQATTSPTKATASAPSTLTILLASASPEQRVRVRVDKEFQQIIDKLRGSRYRDRLRVVQVPAVRFEDLRVALLEHEPHILHLSSHGEADGSLVFESKTYTGVQNVPKKSLTRLLAALGSNLRLVVLNACHSATIARDLAPNGGCSIGMNDSIVDTEAIEFSVALYEALAFGKSVQTSFDTALASLIESDDIPQLYPDDVDDPDRTRRGPLLSGGAP